jgi:hypothetical protein
LVVEVVVLLVGLVRVVGEELIYRHQIIELYT